MKPRTPLPKMSASRTIEAQQYPKLKREFFRTHHTCFKCGEPVPEKQKELHHWAGRTNELLCWVPGFRLACPWCHTWVEAHRNEAAKLGLRAPDRLFNRPSLVIPQ